MFLIKLAILLLCLTNINTQVQLSKNTCPCQNDGVCQTNANKIQFCNCPNNFIDINCTKEAIQLTQQDYTANITQKYNYFFIYFNESSLYYIQILFCPVRYDPSSIYFTKIDFQSQDGSINNDHNSQSYSFKLRQSQCVVAKYVIYPYKKKNNGELIRLIVQIKTNQKYQNTSQGVSMPNQLELSYTIYQFNKINDQDMGKFLLISMGSSSFLFCITFIICRRIVQRRMRRFVYQPAHMARNISSFDTTMPSVLYQQNSNINDEDKQQNTYTRLTPCSHLFHKDCIDEWGRKSLTCPTCRQSLEPDRIYDL